MHKNHERVHRVRAAVLGVIRLVALAMVVCGTVMVLNRLAFGLLGNQDLSQAWGAWMQIGAWHGVFLGLPMVVVGGVLGVLSARLARWIVRPAAGGCARCGYETLDGDGCCTECGYR